MTQIIIRSITAEETRPLRQIMLRPHQAISELDYHGDDNEKTYHVGAFLDDELVGIASVYLENAPYKPEPKSWRLRGMAVLHHVQRKGYGKALLHACLAYIAKQNGLLIWCNARGGAMSFYQRLGFEVHGDAFEIPGIGLHYIMGSGV